MTVGNLRPAPAQKGRNDPIEMKSELPIPSYFSHSSWSPLVPAATFRLGIPPFQARHEPTPESKRKATGPTPPSWQPAFHPSSLSFTCLIPILYLLPTGCSHVSPAEERPNPNNPGCNPGNGAQQRFRSPEGRYKPASQKLHVDECFQHHSPYFSLLLILEHYKEEKGLEDNGR